MNNKIFKRLPLIFLALLLAACNANAPQEAVIEIEDAWVRATALEEAGTDAGETQAESSAGNSMGHAAGGTSAAYLRIKNRGRTADRLIAVQSSAARVVEMHVSEEREGVMMMSRVDGIDIPGLGQVELKPGGLHLMMIDLQQGLVAGQSIRLTLVFEQSGEFEIEAPVRAP
jgi:copper(I)-binding protein